MPRTQALAEAAEQESEEEESEESEGDATKAPWWTTVGAKTQQSKQFQRAADVEEEEAPARPAPLFSFGTQKRRVQQQEEEEAEEEEEEEEEEPVRRAPAPLFGGLFAKKQVVEVEEEEEEEEVEEPVRRAPGLAE